MNSDFGERIKFLRKQRALTQQTLADVLGITKTLVSAYENGARKPSYENLMEIALFFDVSMDWLFANTDDRSGIPTMDLSQLEIHQKHIVMDVVGEFKRLNRTERALSDALDKKAREVIVGKKED